MNADKALPRAPVDPSKDVTPTTSPTTLLVALGDETLADVDLDLPTRRVEQIRPGAFIEGEAQKEADGQR